MRRVSILNGRTTTNARTGGTIRKRYGNVIDRTSLLIVIGQCVVFIKAQPENVPRNKSTRHDALRIRS